MIIFKKIYVLIIWLPRVDYDMDRDVVATWL